MVTSQQWRDWERYWQEMGDENSTRLIDTLAFRFEWASSPWLLRALKYYLELNMARGKGESVSKAAQNGNQWTQFVDIPLGEVSWEDVLAKFGTAGQVDQGVRDLGLNGYRIGISYNGQSDAFIVSVTCRDEGSPNNGFTFTSFAGSWLDAIRIALFKHFVLADGSWPVGQRKSNGPKFG